MLGGPVEGGAADEIGLHLVAAPDEASVRAAFAADPWAERGILRVASVRPWALWLDGRASR